jgi:NAD(P)-dependent dehydrogenase (short-subunit alcohol dehydrogenase family)
VGIDHPRGPRADVPRHRAHPLGRIGEVEDNAQAYLFYLTQPFATGSILTLDGGTVLA